jgi:hypothetical protein
MNADFQHGTHPAMIAPFRAAIALSPAGTPLAQRERATS